MMNTEELENKIFDILEKRGSFLQAGIIINRLNYDNWLIWAQLEKDRIIGTGETKKEALEDLYKKLKEE